MVMSQGGKIIWPASRPRSQKCRSFRTDLTPFDFEVNITVTPAETRILNYEAGLADNCFFSTFGDILSFRSLSRSIDETQIESEEFAKRREDDILGDIRSKIEAKIKNYEDLIEVERSTDMVTSEIFCLVKTIS